MRIVIVAPNGVDDLTPLGSTDRHEIIVISWRGLPSAGALHIEVAPSVGWIPRRARVVWLRAQRNPVGRTLYRLSPFDHGAAFWRRAHRSAPVIEAVRQADLIVAAERDGVFAAWKFARLVSPRPVAVNGFGAGRAALRGRTS